MADTKALLNLCKGKWNKFEGNAKEFSLDAAFTSCSDPSGVSTWDQLICRVGELGEILDLLFGNAKFSALFSKAIKTLRHISSAGAPPKEFAEQMLRQAFVEYGVFIRGGIKTLLELTDGLKNSTSDCSY